MNLRAEIDASLDFLNWWNPAGSWLLAAIPPDLKGIDARTFSDDAATSAWLSEQEARRWNVYFAINPIRSTLAKKPTAADVASLAWLHVDLDPRPGVPIEEERTRILALLQDPANGMPEPSCIVWSGGGYWGFWRLAEPLPITDPDDAKLWNLQVELLLGGDACHNVDRIARLPGTINWPSQRKLARGQLPAVASVLRRTDVAYPLSQFAKAVVRQSATPAEGGGGTDATRVHVSGNVRRVDLDELPAAVASRTKVIILHGYDPDQALSGKDQSRSAWLHLVCCSLVRAGVDDESIYSIITDAGYEISASVRDKGNSSQVHRYAVRQIKQAKEAVIAPELAELNSEYALIESVGGRCRIARESWNAALVRHELDFQLVDGFRVAKNNRLVDGGIDDEGKPRRPLKLGNWWLEHPDRRTFSDVVYLPCVDTARSLNMWRGFAFDAIPGDCTRYLRHVREVICGGVSEWYDYLIRWMAYAVQNPAEPGHVAIVLRGKQGTGKGTFAKHFGALWGVHYKHVTRPEQITGQFNTLLRDASVVFADECFRTDRAHVSALKTLITERVLRAEAKGVDSFDILNCVHLIMATNEEWSVHADLDDRRFFALEVDATHQKDVAYFSAIDAEMAAGGHRALMHYLRTFDLAGFDVRTAPRTSELRVQQRHSLGPAEAMLLTMLEEGEQLPGIGAWLGEVLGDALVERFLVDYNRDRNINAHGARTRLGNLFRRLFGDQAQKIRRRGQTIEWVDSSGRKRPVTNPTMWTFPGLEVCRDAWDEEFGAHAWPPIETDITEAGADPY